jgi:hypothetical protein
MKTLHNYEELQIFRDKRLKKPSAMQGAKLNSSITLCVANGSESRLNDEDQVKRSIRGNG